MKHRALRLISIMAVIVLILTSCGAKNNMGESIASRDEVYYEEKSDSVSCGSTSHSYTSTDGSVENAVNDGRKIIETIDLTVQTKEFDTLLDSIRKEITELGGYIEGSDISGREIDSYNNRSADLTIRIPSDKSSSFQGFIAENSVVINEIVTTKDVTLSYVDMESRVAALEAEKAALKKLLENASSMTDIIDIRNSLTDVIYEIESHKSQLRTYDNLVDYSTVSVYIFEVERTAIVEEQTTWQKIGTNLKNNFENVRTGAVNVFIFLVSAIPYLIPVTVIAVAAVIIVTVFRRSKKKKAIDDKKEEEN